MLITFVLFTIINVDLNNIFYSKIRSWIGTTLSGVCVLTVVLFLFICLGLMVSKFGLIQLADEESRLELSNTSRCAMMVLAAVAIGSLFLGVAEPIFYFVNSVLLATQTTR